MFNPLAKIIADSINGSGDRLTTFVLEFHRYILPEFNTHRAFSRNGSSSRAIPIAKNIKQVRDLNLYPIHWGANQKGMQAYEEVDPVIQVLATGAWNEAREACIKSAERLIDLGIHKQVANRLLEPFNTITMVVTATDYQNFFEQRCHPSAQPEIQALAIAMREAYNTSEPHELIAGEWHIPYAADEVDYQLSLEDCIKVATARCARVSYSQHNTKGINLQKDLELHDRLLSSNPPHLSPFEHCAEAMPSSDKYANFVGWQSYRNQLEPTK